MLHPRYHSLVWSAVPAACAISRIRTTDRDGDQEAAKHVGEDALPPGQSKRGIAGDGREASSIHQVTDLAKSAPCISCEPPTQSAPR